MCDLSFIKWKGTLPLPLSEANRKHTLASTSIELEKIKVTLNYRNLSTDHINLDLEQDI